jgi:hypothetical protein
MKNVIFISAVSACFLIACKTRDTSAEDSASEQQSFVNSESGSRFTVGPVYGESGAGGWCYFNRDPNFKTQTTEHIDSGTLERLSFVTQDLVKKNDGYQRAQYAAKITLRRYTRAHPYALDFNKSKDSLSQGQLGRSTGQINTATLLMNTISTYQNRAVVRSMSAVLCSPESLTTAEQIDQVAQSLNPETASAARLEATCNGQPAGVATEFVSATQLNSPDYKWLRKTVEGLKDFNPKLSCPSEYLEFEVSKGKFLRWVD